MSQEKYIGMDVHQATTSNPPHISGRYADIVLNASEQTCNRQFGNLSGL